MTKIVDGATLDRAAVRSHKPGVRGSLSAPTSAGIFRDAGRAPSAVTLRAGHYLIAEATARGVVPADTGTRLCRLIRETYGD